MFIIIELKYSNLVSYFFLNFSKQTTKCVYKKMDLYHLDYHVHRIIEGLNYQGFTVFKNSKNQRKMGLACSLNKAYSLI